jgi:GT2 family glycosyltransferase
MLVAMIESVRTQTYDNWQLCIAEGNSSESYVREIIQSYIDKDPRITAIFMEENKFISGNSNEALSLAEGEFVGFLDHDDELSPFALFEVVRLLNDDSSIDFNYSDEDRIDVKGKRSLPFFKPDWSPDLLLTVNYICHFAALRHNFLKELGGFRVGYDGAQDYDLFLRASRKTSRIAHIPKILYHWREHEKSTLGDDSRKDMADVSGKAALSDFVRSNGIDAAVVSGYAKTNYLLRYTIKGSPFISIIIPFRDKVELLKKCVDSIIEKTTYKEYELLLISNRSVEEKTFHYIDSVSENGRIKILYFDEEFNFSKLNNYAVRESRGEHFLFLNNDTEVISGDWVSCLLEHSQREEIGTVGCKLLYPDGRIQHAGVVIGMTGFAGHVFAGLPENYYNYFGFTDFVRNVMAVTGACMMVKSGLFEKAGGFNESFTICGSDVDFCLRIHEMGYRNIYVPHAVLYHHESASRDSFIPPDDFELSLKSYKRFLDGRDPYYNPNLPFKAL